MDLNYHDDSAATVLITVSAPKKRGWTDALVRDLLGPPDETKSNPHHRSGPPMRLYALSRVEAAEASAGWAARSEAARKRKESAARAVGTKRVQLLSRLGAVQIKVPVLDGNELTLLACAHYNQRQIDRGDFDYREATSTSDATFLARINVNYLRHCLSDYECALEAICGRVGVRDGYREISRKVYAAIADAYPHVADECQRQFDRKFDEFRGYPLTV